MACGLDPCFIQLENIGEAYRRGSTSQGEIRKIGHAFGAFSLAVFEQFGLGHEDLCLNNCTKPINNSRQIGIIDIASVREIERLEDVFMCPRFESPDLCVAMAERIEAAGHRLDADYMIERMRDLDRVLLASGFSMREGPQHDDRLTRSQATIDTLTAWAESCDRSLRPATRPASARPPKHAL